MLKPSRIAAKELGMHPHTLRKYASLGLIKCVRNAAGQRLYDTDSFLGKVRKQVTIGYARVSSAGQKPDLERQTSSLSNYATEIIRDVGSGLNYKRKGLRALLERALRGDRIKLVVAHRDRLARFGSELIEFIIKQTGGEIVFLDQAVGGVEEEFTKDLLHILHVFSCRMYGRRKYQAKVRAIEEDTYLSQYGTEELIAALVRRIEKDLQRDGKLSKS